MIFVFSSKCKLSICIICPFNERHSHVTVIKSGQSYIPVNDEQEHSESVDLPQGPTPPILLRSTMKKKSIKKNSRDPDDR